MGMLSDVDRQVRSMRQRLGRMYNYRRNRPTKTYDNESGEMLYTDLPQHREIIELPERTYNVVMRSIEDMRHWINDLLGDPDVDPWLTIDAEELNDMLMEYDRLNEKLRAIDKKFEEARSLGQKPEPEPEA